MLRYVISLGFLVVSISAQAEPLRLSISEQRSYVLLHWRMIGKAEYHARITGLQGQVRINPQRDSDDSLQVKMPIANLDAHHNMLTWALKSASFFDQSRYPYATFTSSRIIDLGAGRYRVLGSLTIKDQQHPVMLYAQRSADSRLVVEQGNVRLSGQVTVSRHGFGMGQYPALVADPIRVEIVIIATSS